MRHLVPDGGGGLHGLTEIAGSSAITGGLCDASCFFRLMPLYLKDLSHPENLQGNRPSWCQLLLLQCVSLFLCQDTTNNIIN
jgi:hypothetical protein